MASLASVRVVPTAFGKGLVAARDFEAGETVLAEQPGFLLVDGAPVARPRLLSAVSGALGLPPGAEKSVLLYGGLELWLRSDAAARAVLLQIFSTPDDVAMAEFMLGVVEAGAALVLEGHEVSLAQLAKHTLHRCDRVADGTLKLRNRHHRAKHLS